MAELTAVPVEYVGKKPFAVDNVAGSGKVWAGKGDVQMVSEDKALKLANFPDQWKINLAAVPIQQQSAEAALKALKELGASLDTPVPEAGAAAAAATVASLASAAVAAAKKPKGAAKKPADDFKV